MKELLMVVAWTFVVVGVAYGALESITRAIKSSPAGSELALLDASHIGIFQDLESIVSAADLESAAEEVSGASEFPSIRVKQERDVFYI